MAKNNELNFNLPSVDDLFEPAQGKDLMELKKIIPIKIKDISDFPDHPFKVVDDEKMEDMVNSIKERGVMFPVIVRPKKDGGYEMISGHRRKRARELANIDEIPCIIRDLSDEEATIFMVDTNIQQREEILPSEKAFAYKMKLDALNHQGSRTDLTSRQPVEKSVSVDLIGEQSNESGRQVQRYIRLTELIPELLELVDNQILNNKDMQKMSFLPAVELSYLKDEEQYVVLNWIECNDATPSHAQAIVLKKLSQEKNQKENENLTVKEIEDVLGEEKPNQIPKYKLNQDRFADVLPKNVRTEKEVEDFLYNCAVEHNKRQKMREMAR